MQIIQDQVLKIANDKDAGLLTFGMLGTIWSTSSGVDAIISTLNQAYDIQEARPWWKVKLTALALTVALAAFVVASTVLVIAGPAIAERIANIFYLGSVFTWAWLILQWPIVFALVSFAVAVVYYYAPDARQEWIWITPGSIFATFTWMIVSLIFRFYVTNFGSYNATYGAIGGVIVVLLWFYLSGLAILVGAELNAEIEHASPYGKEPGERAPGEKKEIGALAQRTWEQAKAAGTFKPALAAANCAVDGPPHPAVPDADRRPRASDWILSGIVAGEIALLTYAKLRSRLRKILS
jgi:membrane protein